MRLPFPLLAALLLLATPSCTTTTSSVTTPCDVAVFGAKPSSGAPGTSIEMPGRHFTSAYDTAVFVGTARATVTALERNDACDACESCREAESCSTCDDCDTCANTCDACLEQVWFTVPDVAAGSTTVRLVNRHGESGAILFEVLPSSDAADTGAAETGAAETGAAETGAGDTGP